MAAHIYRSCLVNPSFKAVFPLHARPTLADNVSRLPSLLSSCSSRQEHARGALKRIHFRNFQHLAQPQPPAKAEPQTPQPGPSSAPPKQDLGGDAVHITQAEQRRRDWEIIRKLTQNLWPKGDYKTRGRVVFGFGLLVGGKVCARSSMQKSP